MLDKSKYFLVGENTQIFRFNLDPLGEKKSNPFLYLRKKGNYVKNYYWNKLKFKNKHSSLKNHVSFWNTEILNITIEIAGKFNLL